MGKLTLKAHTEGTHFKHFGWQVQFNPKYLIYFMKRIGSNRLEKFYSSSIVSNNAFTKYKNSTFHFRAYLSFKKKYNMNQIKHVEKT